MGTAISIKIDIFSYQRSTDDGTSMVLCLLWLVMSKVKWFICVTSLVTNETISNMVLWFKIIPVGHSQVLSLLTKVLWNEVFLMKDFLILLCILVSFMPWVTCEKLGLRPGKWDHAVELLTIKPWLCQIRKIWQTLQNFNRKMFSITYSILQF